MKMSLKKITAVLTAAVMLLSVPVSVMAYDDDYYDDEYYDDEYYENETSEYSNYFIGADSDDDSDSSKQSSYDPEKNTDSGDVATPKNNGFGYSASDVNAALFAEPYYYKENSYFSDEARVYGEGALCTDIRHQIQTTADTIGMNVAVFLGGAYRDDNDTKKFTKDSLIKLFGNEQDTNSVFLYLDFEGHKPSFDYICTQHDAKLYYSNGTAGLSNRVSTMVEDMYEHLPSSGSTIYRSSVTKAINVFLEDLVKYHQSYAPEVCYFNEEKGVYRYNFLGTIIEQTFRPYKYAVIFLGLGLFLGIIIAICISSSIKRKYKFRETISASSYTSRNRKQFLRHEDIFVREHTTSHRIEHDSGGSGGGGGGGGYSGGGSFGGGGGHR